METIIKVSNLVKRYGGFTAVDRISFSVAKGEVFALLGPNGAGKTSTIRVLMGILLPDEGEVRLFGKEPHEVRNLVGYLPEARGLYRGARLLPLLTYLGTLKGMPEAKARASALAWLKRFGLEKWAKRKVRELSHGMQQKVQLAVALMHDPAILVLDEPFQGLDPVNVQIVKDLVREARESGKTVLLSSHQLVHVEALADSIALINEGKIVAYGTLEELKRRYSRGDVALKLENDAPLPEGLPITKAWREGESWHLLPKSGTSPKEILRLLVEAGAPVERYEVVYPSLEEIFLRAVEESGESQGR